MYPIVYRTNLLAKRTYFSYSRIVFLRFTCLTLISILLVACTSTTEDIFRKRVDNTILWEQYQQMGASAKDSHELVLQILSILRSVGNEYVAPFLLEHMQKDAENPYRSYYEYLIAQHYVEQKEYELACIYARRSANSDIIVEGISIQQESLTLLSRLSYSKWEQSTALLAKNQSNDISDIETTKNLYAIAKLYNDMGRWDEMYQVYLDYLSIEKKIESNRYKQVLHWVARYNSDRSWTFSSLETLVANIQVALAQKNPSQLLRYRAKDSFFTMSWNQELFDENSRIRTFNITPFLRRSSVRYSLQIDPTSNEKEAYLRTWGWSYRIPTWYFYFRKVDFPADSTVHGNWEWAGIFFGDTL